MRRSLNRDPKPKSVEFEALLFIVLPRRVRRNDDEKRSPGSPEAWGLRAGSGILERSLFAGAALAASRGAPPLPPINPINPKSSKLKRNGKKDISDVGFYSSLPGSKSSTGSGRPGAAPEARKGLLCLTSGCDYM